MALIRKIFLEHPGSVGETYLQHLANATRYGLSLTGAGLACLLHGIVPALHKRTASKVVLGLSAELEGRNAAARASSGH